MTDIVERLRHQVRDLHGDDFTSPYEGFVSPLDAADEIERLRADNERLRAALRDVIDAYTWWSEDQYDRDQSVVGDAIYEARAALKEEKDW